MKVTSLHHLTDDELVNHADNQSEMVTTELETELAERFSKLLDEKAERDELFNTASEKGFETGHLVRFIEVLADFNCEDIKSLREKLERADKFYDIAADLQGDAIHRLNTLIQATN